MICLSDYPDGQKHIFWFFVRHKRSGQVMTKSQRVLLETYLVNHDDVKEFPYLTEGNTVYLMSNLQTGRVSEISEDQFNDWKVKPLLTTENEQ